MKVVLCANTSWFIYNFCRTLTIEIKNSGHEVFVITPFDEHTKKLQELGVKWFHLDLHQTSKNPFKELRSLVHLLRLIKRIHPDFVLTYTIKCNVYIGLLARIVRFKQIATIAGLGEAFDKKSFFNKFICYLYRIAFKKSQRVFFQNTGDLLSFIQRGLLAEGKGGKIPGLGVNLSRFRPRLKHDNSEKRIFLMFGRILPQKRYDLFLQAARMIKHEHNTNAEFWILGIQDTSRKESVKLFEKILAYHEQNIITYLPPTDDVVPILHQVDVVVLPSEYNEGVPACLLEAMACGKPIITTNWKGCKDTVNEGINGYLIEKGSIESLKNAVNFFIRADTEVLRKMGEASRKKVEKEFNEQFIISKYLAEIDTGRSVM